VLGASRYPGSKGWEKERPWSGGALEITGPAGKSSQPATRYTTSIQGGGGAVKEEGPKSQHARTSFELPLRKPTNPNSLQTRGLH